MIKEDKVFNDRPKVLHFPIDFTLKEIEKILEERNNILYFTRIVKDELHLIKHNKDGFFSSQKLIESLFKHYEKNDNLKVLLSGVKIKGNDNFSIINNIPEKLIEKIKHDLNKLLLK